MSPLRQFLRGLVRGISEPFKPSTPDDYVYVNQDGSARELAPDERRYLSQSFAGGDGARPYIKFSYDAVDGWGSLSGFLSRREVPRRIQVEPVNPAYVPVARNALRESHEDNRRAGDLVVENPDGSVSTTPNTKLGPKQRFELLKQFQLERQREHENRARHPDHPPKSASR